MGISEQHSVDKEYWGMKFKWTKRHRTPEELKPLIYTYDEVSTKALESLDEIDPTPAAALAPREGIHKPYEPKGKPKRDLFKLLQKNAEHDENIRNFWTEVKAVPEWVDWEQIERGQKVFWRYGGAAVTALTYLSLLGGMGGGRTVETLDRTGGFSVEVVRRRLLETTQHTLGVHRDLESIKPGGEGWEASVRVRLLHSSVRRRILQLAAEKPEYYDTKKYGVPVNDLDCIGTINTFSTTVVWMGLPRQGIQLTARETLDFLALWRYVAYLMGTPHDWLATPEDARAMMESILVSEIKPTEKSGTLANNIVHGFEGTPPIYPSRGFLNAQTWWLNGSELSRALRIEKPGPYHFALVLTQCWTFMLTGYIARLIPAFDAWHIKYMKNLYYDLFIHNKEKGALGYKAKYTFKWIPGLAYTTTPLGVSDEERRKSSGAFRMAGIERVILLTMLSTLTGLGLAGVGAVKLAQSYGLTEQLMKGLATVAPLSSA